MAISHNDRFLYTLNSGNGTVGAYSIGSDGSLEFIGAVSGLPAPPEITRAQAEREFSPMRLSFLSEARIVDTTKMREVLGVEPRYANPVEGIRASL